MYELRRVYIITYEKPDNILTAMFITSQGGQDEVKKWFEFYYGEHTAHKYKIINMEYHRYGEEFVFNGETLKFPILDEQKKKLNINIK